MRGHARPRNELRKRCWSGKRRGRTAGHCHRPNAATAPNLDVRFHGALVFSRSSGSASAGRRGVVHGRAGATSPVVGPAVSAHLGCGSAQLCAPVVLGSSSACAGHLQEDALGVSLRGTGCPGKANPYIDFQLMLLVFCSRFTINVICKPTLLLLNSDRVNH